MTCKPALRVAGSLAAYKLFLLAFVGALPWLWRGAFNLSNFSANFHWPPDAVPSWSTLFATWDSQHYLYLAEKGYVPGAVSNSFYPLWPCLLRVLAPLFLGSLLACGLALSNLLSLQGLRDFYLYIKEGRDEAAARGALLFLLAYPGAFFFGLPYSESLYLALAAALLLNLRRERFGLAAVFMFLLPISRAQGVFAALPYWYALRRAGRRRWEDAGYWVAPLLGVCADLGFMLYSTGDAFERFRVYRDVYHQTASLSRVLDLPALARDFFHLVSWSDIAGSPLDRLWLVLLLACLPALWKKDRLLFVYTLPIGLFPIVTVGYVSYTRYFLAVFPVFLVVADFFAGRPRVWRWAALAASWALQLALLARHANNYWVA